jgi:hypothetical protein
MYLPRASNSASVLGVLGACRIDGRAVSVGGDGVRGSTSSLEITLSGSKGARPAPSKPSFILGSVMVAL